VIWVCGEAEFFSKKGILFESGWTGKLDLPVGQISERQRAALVDWHPSIKLVYAVAPSCLNFNVKGVRQVSVVISRT
jgi:hypothetical protein